MASGNMGDLEFSLTLKSRVEDETRKVIQELNKVDASGKKAQEALTAIAEAVRSIDGMKHGNLEKLSNLFSSLEKQRDHIMSLETPNLGELKTAKGLQSSIDALNRVDEIISSLAKSGKSGMSIFPNNIATEVNNAKRSLEDINKLVATLNQKGGEGLSNLGVKATDNIRQAESALSKYRTTLEQIRANGGIHPITSLTASDVTKSAEYINAVNAAKAAVKELNAANKEASDEYDRQKRQREASKAAQEAELKAMSDYAKRYMELQEAKRKAYEKATADAKRESEKRTAQVQSDTRKMSELYSILGVAKDKAEKVGMNGLALNVDTSKLEAKLKVAEDLMNRIFNENVKTLGLGGSMSSSDYATEVRNVKRALDDATASQKELNRAKEQSNKTNKREAEKKAAQDARDAANAEKQRQSEIKKSESRYDALDRALVKLRAEAEKSVALNVDTTKIDAKIHELESKIQYVASIMNQLKGGDLSAIGQLGGIGTGRDITLANRLLSSQAAANKEAAKGIEIEQKRQQEIARSAAKARNDLASAFSKVNEEAKKMQGIVGDIKSLFLQGGLVFGAQQFFNSIVQTGGEIVQQHVALRSILGDVQKADELFAQTQQLALQSPFKFGELNRDVKQLAAFGVEANDLYDTAKRLADIASGLGVSFERLGLAYGQVKARSWLDGKELRQFAYAGLPLLQRITELYNQEGKNGRNNYTQADVKKMISGRQVSFEDVQKVLWNMTNEGGQFYNMQLVLSETLLGRWNKLIDAWDIMLGRFAEGKNIIGGTFSFAIDRVTDLVLTLDKLSPAVLTFGSLLALRKVSTAVSSKVGIGSNLAALKAEQQTKLRTFAVEQQQLLIEGKITQEKMRQNIADYQGMLNSKATTRNVVEQAALEGRLSALKLQKAFREKLITPELVKQLHLMGMISAKETELIMKQGGRARGMLMLNQGMGKMGGFFSGWNLATTGLTIGAALWSGYKSFKDSIKQDADNIAGSARSKLESLTSVLKDVDVKASGAALQEQVDKMTDVLKESNLYTDTIKDQIDHTNDLGKEYDILKQKIIEAKEANNFGNGEAEMYAKAKKATGAGFAGGSSWFGQWTGIGQDDIDENINDVASSLAALQIKMEKFGGETKASMEKVADSMLGASAAGMSFEEKIGKIASKDNTELWRQFVNGVCGGDRDIRRSLNNLRGDFTDFGRNFREITTDDIPKYLEEMAKSRNMSLDEFSRWCQAHPEKFKTMLDQMLSEANGKVPGLVERLQSVAMAILNIGTAKPKQTDSNKPKTWKNPLKVGTVGRKTFDKLYDAGKLSGGEGNFWQKEMSEFIYNLDNGTSSGWESFGEAVRKKYKEYRSENDASKAAGEEQPYLRQQRMLEAIASQVGIDLDNGKKNPGGNTQEDKALKDLKARIDLYKKMYAEIKKYKDLFGEGALEQLAQDGEFSAIFGDKKRFPISDYTNYETSVKELLSTLPTTTEDRKNYVNTEKAGIQTENRKLLADARNDELAALNSQLGIIQEQYETYKKIYELTGNKQGAENIAFGGAVQYDSYKQYLEGQLAAAVAEDNAKSGQSYTAEAVGKMSVQEVKSKYGEDTKTYAIRNRLEEQSKKLKSETINLLADLIEKNVTIAQQIEDENRKYERQLELIENIEDPQMKQRAKEGAEKNHNETTAKLQFEQFKQDSDWVAIFDDLDRVSTATINTMIDKINDFSKTTGLSVEVVKQLRDALSKLRDEHIERSPFSHIFGEVGIGNEIGGFIKSNFKKGAEPTATAVVSADQAKRWGLGEKGGKFKKSELEGAQRSAYSNSAKAVSKVAQGMQALSDVLQPVVGLFQAMGEEDSVLGQVTGGATNALTSAASTAGAFDTLSKAAGDGALGDALGSAGPYAAAAAAALSVGGSLISAFGANYSDYNKAKDEYNNLISTWDTLISKKKEYLSESWGTEAEKASKEALALLQSEIKQTKIIAQQRLESGSSAGSHSIGYRMWQGSYQYNGQNWQDVAKTISSKYGVRFNSMTDLLNMSSEILEKIKTDYSGLWAVMDEDFKEYLDKLIEYGDQVDEMTDTITEKLTGNSFTDLVSSWGEAMSAMSNSSDDLVEHFESNLKNAILKAMVQNIYGKQIEALMSKTKKYGENNDKITDSSGNVISEYTTSEMADIMKTTDDLSEQIEATRDDLKKRYGWSDDSSSSSTNSVKSITEDTADIIVSYVNGMRADLSMLRESQSKYLPEMSEIAKSQLSHLNLIAQNTLRNADAAERIEVLFTEYNDNFNRVLNGTKTLSVK